MRKILLLAVLLSFGVAYGQSGYWQQRVNYKMDVNMDHTTHRYTGKQELVYYNNSPDVLDRVYYHLYMNAFQPGSMMDVRSRTIEDPDPRVGSRINELKPEEQGYLHIKSLTQNGKAVTYSEEGTILEVMLAEPLKPGKKATFEMNFEGQVPVQIRRNGRNSEEGVDYSMAQWYPKLAEYDRLGWHTDPYVGREFYGVWGDFEVNITMDSAYTLAFTGILQNPEEIGHGYAKKTKETDGSRLTWKIQARNVHDFVWAADTDYIHTDTTLADGTKLHFFYLDEEKYQENWSQLPEYTARTFEYANEHFGKYPYKSYSVIQGGDGGMEYPMATLITGDRGLGSLVGVMVHEVMHSWYQMVLATNESLYPWMDEGFTSYASSCIMSHLFNPEEDSRTGSYMNGYIRIANSEFEEPMSTHADMYITNYAYGSAAYNKGAVFVAQLGYVVGENILNQILLAYFDKWKFKHPTPQDFIRVAEEESGIQLDWYLSNMVNTVNKVDYGIKEVRSNGNNTVVTLQRIENFPMPIDLVVTTTEGATTQHNIPLRIMHGAKSSENEYDNFVVEEPWPWTNPTYTISLPFPADQIATLEIDPSKRMADTDRSNNKVDVQGSSFILINN